MDSSFFYLRKCRTIFINLLILSISIYTPLFLYCTFWTFWARTIKFTSFFIKNQHAEEVKLSKIESIKKGLLPVYQPTFSKKYALLNSIYPIGSLPNTFSYYCDEGLGLVKYKTDRFGLRNIDSKWNKLINKSNIFVVGDSFTHGACVNKDLTIPDYINKETNINTINLASGGNGPYEYMALMQTILDPILKETDTQNWVVMIFYFNDNVRYKNYSNTLLSKAKSIISLNPSGDISPNHEYKVTINKLIKNNFPTTKNQLIKATQHSNESKFSTLFSILKLQPILVKINEIVKSFSAANNLPNPSNQSINLISEICKHKCTPIIAYIPYNSFWYPAPESRDIIYKNQLKNIALKNNIPFLDASIVIDRNNMHDYSPKGGHLSPKGNKKLGQLISNEIKKLKLSK